MQKIIDGIIYEQVKSGDIHSCEGCVAYEVPFKDPSLCTKLNEGECIGGEFLWQLKPVPSHLTNRHFIDNLWRWKCGLPEEEEKPFEPIDIDKLAKEQMSSRFVELMTNRMVMGTLRYGRWQDNKKNGTRYDRVGSIRKRLQLFEETGNSEYLVDIANFAMIEFEISDHPNLHFSPKDDDGEHVKRINHEFIEKMNSTPIMVGSERSGFKFASPIHEKYPNRPTAKIACKFPMSTRVMTVDGEFWMWKIINGKTRWLRIGAAYIEK